MSPLILYIITDLRLGGVPLHLLRLSLAMREQGFRVAVVSLSDTGSVGAMMADRGLEVRACDGCCGLDFRVISRLGEIMDQMRPDLVHSLLFHANLAARIASALNGFPADRVLCEIQTVEVKRLWHLRVDSLLHRLSRLTIGNSPSVVDHLHRTAGMPLQRLRLVRGGIDAERITSAAPVSRAALGAEENAPIVLWVGRLDPVKGLDLLLHAFQAVTRRTGAHLLLVGDGPQRARLDELCRSLGLGEVVHFLGPRSDVPSLLKTADVFVFPSRTEGLPNALLEAMAAARPIVATDVPGCRDLIAHERTGLLVPYGDTLALGLAIERLINDRPLAHRLGASAQDCAVSQWSLGGTIEEYLAVYRSAMTDRQ